MIGSTLAAGRNDSSTTQNLHLIDPATVTALFDLDLAYETQVTAFTSLSDGHSWQPDKIGGSHEQDDATLFCYAARLDRSSGPVSKFGSVNPGNPALGHPTIHATVTLLHPVTGVPVAILDGTAITAKRTAAASALAARTLALPNTTSVAILGAGIQAAAHVRAISRAFGGNIAFRLWSPRRTQRDEVAANLRAEDFTISARESIADTVRGADVVVAVTRATEPLFDVSVVTPGTVVISVGSFEHHRREVGVDLLRASSDVVVDHTAIAEAHSGPVVHMRTEGETRPLVNLGDVVTGRAGIRERDPHGIVTYLSVGLGVQDAAAAWAIRNRAVEMGLGMSVPW